MLASSIGCPGADGDAPLGPGLDALLQRLGVPTHLRDLGIDGARFDTVVDNILNESPTLGSPDVIRKLCEEML